MKQSRRASLIESALNTGGGFLISLAAQWLMLPLIGVTITFSQNLVFAVIMTFVSIGRGYAFRRLFEALRIHRPLSPAMLAIIAERRRQIDQEGWTAEHDAEHLPGALARAGACYALADAHLRLPVQVGGQYMGAVVVKGRQFWDWDEKWWKPADPRRNLVKAGALILAEIEKGDAPGARKVAL